MGGTHLTITGAGFTNDLVSNIVSVGHGPCAVHAANFSVIECTTAREWTRFVAESELGDATSNSAAVHVSIRNVLSTCTYSSGKESGCTFAHEESRTPRLLSASILDQEHASGARILRLYAIMRTHLTSAELDSMKATDVRVFLAAYDREMMSNIYSPCSLASVTSAGYHAGNTASFELDGTALRFRPTRGIHVVVVSQLRLADGRRVVAAVPWGRMARQTWLRSLL